MATMKPPNVTPPPSIIDQTQNLSQQQPKSAPISMNVTTTSVTNPVSSQPIITKSQHAIVTTTNQVQQTPLALTTQPTNQTRPQIQTTPQQHSIAQQSATATTTQSITQPTIPQQINQTKIQPTQPQQTTSVTPQTVQPITLASTPTSAGPTALVIMPQHPSNTPAMTTKVTPYTTTVNVTTAHVTLAATSQCAPIQLQAPVISHLPNITAPVPLTAHQQSTTIVQPTSVNRPPTTLPVVPIVATTTPIKSEAPKYVCCLLDNGIRCDRVAGNASFSARIQKIVGTKKMNFALDPTVRHAYICEHHKAIITVAKKTTTLARDTKSSARNQTANNIAITPVTQQIGNFNELTRQQTLQHPVNLELLAAQNRLDNNHAGPINNLTAVRAGTQIAYAHYPGPQPNQVAPMDVIMPSGFDINPPNVTAESAPSNNGGVEVDLQQLQVNTLRRYKRHFRVQTRPGLNKMQLAESLKGHFRTLPIIEKEAITYFVYIVKCYRNKLDHNPKAD